MYHYTEECTLLIRTLLHSSLRWVCDGLLNLNFSQLQDAFKQLLQYLVIIAEEIRIFHS